MRYKLTPTSKDLDGEIKGRDLDVVASLVGLVRLPNESDDHFRKRIRGYLFDFPTL